MTDGPRVVSLLPAATEIVAALGHVDRLVGVSHECDHPPEVVDLPVVSRPRREPPTASREIHRNVLELLEDVLSIYRVDPGALRTADPDLIITQDLCEVCAVPEDAVTAAAREHLDRPVEVLTTSPLTLDGVLADVGRIGAALGDEAGAELLAERMRGELDRLGDAVAGRPRPRLALLEWADPPMAGGNWAPELVRLAGADPVLGAPGGHSPTITADELAGADPEVILVAPCGYGLDRALRDRSALAALDGWEQLTAVREGRVAFADGSAYFNRPGPRLTTSAAIVAAVAHGVGPAVELEGRAWELTSR